MAAKKSASKKMEVKSEDKNASSDKTKKIIIVVVVILVVCAVICGVLTLGSGLLLQTGVNQLENELSEYSDDFSQFESDLRDLNGKDQDGFRLFDPIGWPDDMPADVPEFTYGDIVSSSTTEGDSIVTVTLSGFGVTAYDSYKSDLTNASWEIDESVVSNVQYISANKGNLELQFALYPDTDYGFVTVRIN